MKCNYEFTLKFAVPVRTAEPDDWIDRLAEAGCDDALIGTGIPGRLVLDLDRLSPDADSALRKCHRGRSAWRSPSAAARDRLV